MRQILEWRYFHGVVGFLVCLLPSLVYLPMGFLCAWTVVTYFFAREATEHRYQNKIDAHASLYDAFREMGFWDWKEDRKWDWYSAIIGAWAAVLLGWVL